MKRPTADQIYTNWILRNCARMSIENHEKKAGNELFRQSMKDINEKKRAKAAAPAPSPAPITDKPYVLPEVHGNLTYHTSWATSNIKSEVEAIISVLTAYDIPCFLADFHQGPTLTQYTIKLNPGVPVQNIMKREKEFQVALQSNATLRFDNGLVFLEIPAQRGMVYLGDMLIDDSFKASDKFTMAVGMGVDGSKHFIDIEKAHHILISGMTGSGKSIVLHNLIISLLMKHTPDRMHLHIIDPKATEFEFYRPLNICTVVSESDQAADLLRGLCGEMDRRYNILRANGCRDIDSYNAKFPAEPMRRDIVVIDELSDLILSGETVEPFIVRIAQKARACGIHLIIATQYLVAKVVTGLIKANMPTKICLRVGTVINSMAVLDMPGGEKLMGRGDMLFLSNNSLTPVRLQGGFVSESGINNIVYALMQNQ